MSRLPPARVVKAATGLRNRLQKVVRRMVPPEIALLELASGFMATQAVYAVARLGIADVLAGGPLSATDIADAVGAKPDGTLRLLRACATYGVCVQNPDGRFGLTPLAKALRTGTADSILPVVLMLGAPWYQEPWGRLTDTVETGTPGAQSAFGKPLWDHLDDEPEFASTFNDAMARLSALDWPTVRAVYDFSAFSTIVDIGGGFGEQLALILEAAPAATGVLFERTHVAKEAEEHLRRAGVLDRCRIEVGSFFETAPSGGDLVVLRRVIHDFDDEQAVAILTNLRRHMSPGATLLIIESVVPPGNAPHFAKLLDLDVMIFVGGRERTEQQFEALLDRAGFRLSRLITTLSTLSLIEATLRR